MYHPDHNPDGQELFQNITEAYQVLGDPDLRRIYDQQSILRPMYTSPEPKTTHSHEPTVEPNEPVKADIRYTMNCTLEDLYNGNSKKRFTVKRNIFCSDCTTNSRSSCKTCCGKNIVQQKRIMKVNINKGMKSGQSIIFPGDGDQYARNKFGDAVFTVKQQPHDRFSRVGDHLFTRYEMDTADTNSGFFNIRHLDGRVLRVQHKNTVAVKCVVNEGMPQYQNSTQRGHLYIALEKKDPSTKLDSITVPHTTFVDAQVIDVPHSELSALNIPASFLSK
jgi:DnaJ-class molecular chaperone